MNREQFVAALNKVNEENETWEPFYKAFVGLLADVVDPRTPDEIANDVREIFGSGALNQIEGAISRAPKPGAHVDVKSEIRKARAEARQDPSCDSVRSSDMEPCTLAKGHDGPCVHETPREGTRVVYVPLMTQLEICEVLQAKQDESAVDAAKRVAARAVELQEALDASDARLSSYMAASDREAEARRRMVDDLTRIVRAVSRQGDAFYGEGWNADAIVRSIGLLHQVHEEEKDGRRGDHAAIRGMLGAKNGETALDAVSRAALDLEWYEATAGLPRTTLAPQDREKALSARSRANSSYAILDLVEEAVLHDEWRECCEANQHLATERAENLKRLRQAILVVEQEWLDESPTCGATIGRLADTVRRVFP